MYSMIVEQTSSYAMRMVYDPSTKSFRDSIYKSLSTERGFKGVYGWLVNHGQPPQDHLDIYLITQKTYDLGDTIQVKPIGVFYRADGDHKIIATLPDDPCNDLAHLDEVRKANLSKLYPTPYPGDAWLNAEQALKVISTWQPKY